MWIFQASWIADDVSDVTKYQQQQTLVQAHKYSCCISWPFLAALPDPVVLRSVFLLTSPSVSSHRFLYFYSQDYVTSSRLVLIDCDFTLLDHSIDEGYFVIRTRARARAHVRTKKGDFVIIFILIASTYQTSDLLMNPRRLGQQSDSDCSPTHLSLTSLHLSPACRLLS